MYALRERRVHVNQEDFEMAVAKVCVTILFAVFCRNLYFQSPFTTYIVSKKFKHGAQVHLTSPCPE